MPAAIVLPDRLLNLPLTHGVVDDFIIRDTTLWTATLTDSGTANAGDVIGGQVQLVPSDGTVADNDEAYIATSKQTFKIQAGKPLKCGVRLQFTEAATNAANVAFGFMDSVAANAIVDNGAGLKTSFSGAGIYKVDGSSLWECIYSDGATQTKSGQLTASNVLNSSKLAQSAGGSSFVTLEIALMPFSASKLSVEFMINGVCVYKMMERTYANAAQMSLWAGAKNGSANNEAINIDWIYGVQKR